jgi:hypothetical protein
MAKQQPSADDPQVDPQFDEDQIEESIEVSGVPLVVWAARLTIFLLVQSMIVLAAYAYYGFGTEQSHFGPGFRLDPIHASINLVWGLAGSVIGFFMPRFSIAFVLAFAVFYTLFASLACGSTLPTTRSTGCWHSPPGPSAFMLCGRQASAPLAPLALKAEPRW